MTRHLVSPNVLRAKSLSVVLKPVNMETAILKKRWVDTVHQLQPTYKNEDASALFEVSENGPS